MFTDEDLRAIDLLDGGREAEFDRITALVSRLLACDVALLSVLDPSNDRQVFKSEHGLEAPYSVARQTPLSHSFCKTVVFEARSVRVTDARRDPRFADNPAVDALGVIAYLGAPIEGDAGQPLGSLCAISGTPRDWSDEDAETLHVLAGAVSREVQLRLALREKRKAAETLEAANDRFRDLANNIPGAIFQYILYPDGSDRVDYMSPGCVDIWEATAEEIRAQPDRVWDIIAPEEVPGMQASINRSAELLVPWEHRWGVVTRSGVRKVLQGYGRPQRRPDGSTLWNSVIFDVTIEAEAQAKLRTQDRRLADMQKQDMIGRLAGGVAHDFNNLLAIIMGNAELLLPDCTDSDAREFINEIMLAAQRGSELTQSLLGFARRSDLRPETTDLNAAIDRMRSLIRRTLPEHIAIEVNLKPDLDRVEVDRGGLERVLLNLAVNARDAMPGGGRLTIETAGVRITDDYIADRYEDIAAGAYVMLAVSDTGTGIPAGVLDRVFEPFFSTKGPEGGTGLGLAVVHGFAKQSGGTVRIYSEEGHGTSVKIYLPVAAAGEAAGRDGEAAAPAAGAGTILVVEDNDAVRRTVQRLLEGTGYDVITAPSGDAALERLDAGIGSVDLVLTDVVMPGRLQGPDLVRRVREVRPDMPVILMSGYPHEANVHGNGIRATDISLMKPVASADLLLAIAQSLGRSGEGGT